MYCRSSKCCIEGNIYNFIISKFKFNIPPSSAVAFNMPSRTISMDIIFKFELYKLRIYLNTLIYAKGLFKISSSIFILVILIIRVVIIISFIVTGFFLKLILYFIMFFLRHHLYALLSLHYLYYFAV